MLEFKSFDTYKVKERGLIVYIVENPMPCSNWSHLVGQTVEIDGKVHLVYGVESYAIYRHALGEKIGLAVLDNGVSEPLI